jgi:hypothetical protein
MQSDVGLIVVTSPAPVQQVVAASGTLLPGDVRGYRSLVPPPGDSWHDCPLHHVRVEDVD